MDFTSMNNNSQGLLNLSKGGVLDLTKQDKVYSKINVGGGWDVTINGPSADLDLSAFLLDRNGRITDTSRQVVFFNQMRQNGIFLNGDNRTGAGEGDDEVISIDLNNIDSNIDKIVFFITIFEAQQKAQNFGQVSNAFIRLVDATDDSEIVRYNLTDNYSTDTAVTAAELFRNPNGGWSFKAIGEGSISDLNQLVSRYI